MAAIAAVAIGVVAADELGIARPQRPAIGVDAEAEPLQGLAILAAQWAAIGAHRLFGPRLLHPGAEARADRVERIAEIGPARRPVGADMAERARLTFPARIRPLRGLDLIGVHAREEIVARVEGADMIEAEPAPVRRLVATRALARRRAEFARQRAARLLALPPGVDASVETRSRSSAFTVGQSHSPYPNKAPYIGRMNTPSTGPVAAEITRRLTSALSPTRLVVSDD